MTEWVLVTGIEAVDVVRAVVWKGDRRMAEFLVGGVWWWVDGICGGVQEGVGVGMARIGWEGGGM